MPTEIKQWTVELISDFRETFRKSLIFHIFKTTEDKLGIWEHRGGRKFKGHIGLPWINE